MNTELLMDFTVDKKNNAINVIREFAAGKDLVWAAWTEPELLDQWWAPRPFKSVTKSMDFSVGGRRLYKMGGPKGEEQWCFADYTSITPKENFTYTDGFCDSNGEENEIHPGSDWSVDFSEADGVTTVVASIKYKSLADLEKIIEMGFKEGFSMALENLDELFSS